MSRNEKLGEGRILASWMRNILVVLVCVFYFSGTAEASYISLKTALSAKIENNVLKVMTTVVNRGDETAYNIQAEVKAAGKEMLTEKEAELPVNRTYHANFSIPLPRQKPGTYPLVLKMYYTDANQYPFSALSCQPIINQKEAVSPLFGNLKSVSFSKEGKIEYILKNFSDLAVAAEAALVLPRELTTDKGRQRVLLPPRSEKTLYFPIRNFSALPGSSYQVFAVSESEDQVLHYTQVSPGTVTIVAAQGIFGLTYFNLFLILVVLLMVFIIAQFYTRK